MGSIWLMASKLRLILFDTVFWNADFPFSEMERPLVDNSISTTKVSLYVIRRTGNLQRWFTAKLRLSDKFYSLRPFISEVYRLFTSCLFILFKELRFI